LTLELKDVTGNEFFKDKGTRVIGGWAQQSVPGEINQNVITPSEYPSSGPKYVFIIASKDSVISTLSIRIIHFVHLRIL
jgi:hypothetical protein